MVLLPNFRPPKNRSEKKMKTTIDPSKAPYIAAAVERLFCTGPELAERLCLNQRTFYHLLKNGRIGPVPLKLNSLTRFKLSDVAKWIEHDCPPRDRFLELLEREALEKAYQD